MTAALVVLSFAVALLYWVSLRELWKAEKEVTPGGNGEEEELGILLEGDSRAKGGHGLGGSLTESQCISFGEEIRLGEVMLK